MLFVENPVFTQGKERFFRVERSVGCCAESGVEGNRDPSSLYQLTFQHTLFRRRTTVFLVVVYPLTYSKNTPTALPVKQAQSQRRYNYFLKVITSSAVPASPVRTLVERGNSVSGCKALSGRGGIGRLAVWPWSPPLTCRAGQHRGHLAPSTRPTVEKRRLREQGFQNTFSQGPKSG